MSHMYESYNTQSASSDPHTTSRHQQAANYMHSGYITLNDKINSKHVTQIFISQKTLRTLIGSILTGRNITPKCLQSEMNKTHLRFQKLLKHPGNPISRTKSTTFHYTINYHHNNTGQYLHKELQQTGNLFLTIP